LVTDRQAGLWRATADRRTRGKTGDHERIERPSTGEIVAEDQTRRGLVFFSGWTAT
jgi:hypothetical protein